MGELTPAIQVEKLSFAYDGRPILNEISLEIPAGQFTVLLGKNGSGKSTLMRILGGFLEFERGAVQIMGKKSAPSRPGGAPASSATYPNTTDPSSPSPCKT